MSALYSIATIRCIESRWLQVLPAGMLMRRAARAVADEVERHARSLDPGRPILAVAGPGSNGADALLAGLLLAERGFEVRAVALAAIPPAAPDAASVWAAWQSRLGAPMACSELVRCLSGQPLVIDGLFGIGLTRPLEGLAAEAIETINRSGMPIVAVDVPSGLDADRGSIVGGARSLAIRATATVTMIADKPGLHTGAALDRVGRLVVADLGLAPGEDSTGPAADGTLFDRDEASRLTGPRLRDSHKGSFGSVLIAAGAATMRGAALLAAAGAQAGGAGKIFVSSPDGPIFDPGQPQWMTRAWFSTSDALQAFDAIDALVIGCGLGTGEPCRLACERVLAGTLPLVVDADALTAIAAQPALQSLLQARTVSPVLTPHPREAARLLNCSVESIQSDRIAAARTLAAWARAVVVLKGAGTVVAAPAGHWSIIGSGSPSLATAGTGDVLAGLIGALQAQGHDPESASLLAAWSHGLGGEMAQQCLPFGIGMAAAELPDYVRRVLNGR